MAPRLRPGLVECPLKRILELRQFSRDALYLPAGLERPAVSEVSHHAIPPVGDVFLAPVGDCAVAGVEEVRRLRVTAG